MVKKALSFLVAALLLVPLFASAQSPYIHETDPWYSYTCPEGWAVLAGEDMSKLIEQGASKGNIAGSLAAEFKGFDATAFKGPGGDEYILILPLNLGVSSPADQMILFLRTILESQAISQIPGAKITNNGEVVRYGENDFVKFSATAAVSGQSIDASFYVLSKDGTQYVLVSIAKAGEENVSPLEETLASFTLQK